VSERNFDAEKKRPLSVLHPALVVGVRGPTPWPGISSEYPSSESEARQNAAFAGTDSLTSLLLVYSLNGTSSASDNRNRTLPPWFFTFGIVYDASQVTIIAHIPFYDVSAERYCFLSHVVDNIPFSGGTSTHALTEEDAHAEIDRIRILLALLTVGSHSRKFCSLWDNQHLFPRAVHMAEPLWDTVGSDFGSGSDDSNDGSDGNFGDDGDNDDGDDGDNSDDSDGTSYSPDE
jgi:hypothetical protein